MAVASTVETSAATVEVLALTLTQARGRLIGLAMLEITLDGVSILLQGVRVVRRPDGFAVVEMPCCRHADGDLIPAVVFPEELDEAIAQAVLRQVAPAAVLVPLPA